MKPLSEIAKLNSCFCKVVITLEAVVSPGRTLRYERERNHCEHSSASLIEPPSSAMDE